MSYGGVPKKLYRKAKEFSGLSKKSSHFNPESFNNFNLNSPIAEEDELAFFENLENHINYNRESTINNIDNKYIFEQINATNRSTLPYTNPNQYTITINKGINIQGENNYQINENNQI